MYISDKIWIEYKCFQQSISQDISKFESEKIRG
nr:MAG TPA: hypothetical protein [Caudoviricetes sp.]